MARITIGGLKVNQRLFHGFAAIGAIAALAGGLALGVANASALPASNIPPAVPPSAPSGPGTGQIARPIPVPPPIPRRPVHMLIAARLKGQPAPRGQIPSLPGAAVTGRLVEFDPAAGTALVTLPQGQQRTVRITSQTKLPIRRPKPGDFVIAVGRRAPDGTFIARAVLARPQRTASTTTSGQRPG